MQMFSVIFVSSEEYRDYDFRDKLKSAAFFMEVDLAKAYIESQSKEGYYYIDAVNVKQDEDTFDIELVGALNIGCLII